MDGVQTRSYFGPSQWSETSSISRSLPSQTLSAGDALGADLANLQMWPRRLEFDVVGNLHLSELGNTFQVIELLIQE